MMFIQIACILGLFIARPAAAEFPGILIDYTRLPPANGVSDLPARLLKLIPAPRANLILQWVVIDERDQIQVRVVDAQPHLRRGGTSVVRALTLSFASLDEYRALIGAHPALHINPEILPILRERRREVGLSSQLGASDDHTALLPRILQDAAVLRQLPPGLEWFKFNMRAVELQAEGRVRLSVSGVADGEAFFKAVDFDNLDEFNRVSGENVAPDDFARPTLLFWVLPDRGGMSESNRGRYVMKTRAEVSRQCANLLLHGIAVTKERPAEI